MADCAALLMPCSPKGEPRVRIPLSPLHTSPSQVLESKLLARAIVVWHCRLGESEITNIVAIRVLNQSAECLRVDVA